ncbi:MAG: FAD-dependent oxidoreductase, partial [Emcibacter sp.]|nr:FAD-dependent oxidoreductase [Emcibacter sp.]
ANNPAEFKLLGPDYQIGLELAHSVKNQNINHVKGAEVWNIEHDTMAVFYALGGKTYKAFAKRIILATGAMERSVPIPGWTMPGVMGVGAAQIMLKSNAMTPSGRVVLAGSGPLLLLVANQLLESGCNIVAILETTKSSNYLRAAPYLPKALMAFTYLIKGHKLRTSLKRHGINFLNGVSDISVSGDNHVQSISYRHRGRVYQVDADLLLYHEGVVPNVQLTRLIKADHEWYARQDYWRPIRNEWGETSCGGIFIAGDGGGIDGAVAAEALGRLAAYEALSQIGYIRNAKRNNLARPARKLLNKQRRVRPLLDILFPPPRYAIDKVNSDTIICRCMEITAGEITNAVRGGCKTPDQVKSYCRSAMGPCQGRMCGLSVAALIAKETKQSPLQVGYHNIRAPIKPIMLSELATLEEGTCSLEKT